MSVFYVGVKCSLFFPVFKTSASALECNYCRTSLILSIPFRISCRQVTPQVFRVSVEITKIRSSKSNLIKIRSGAGCLFRCCCWCCGYCLFLLLFQGNIQVPNRLILTPKGRRGGIKVLSVWGTEFWGHCEARYFCCKVSSQTLTSDRDFEMYLSVWSLFFLKEKVKARIITFYGRVRNGDVTTQNSKYL